MSHMTTNSNQNNNDHDLEPNRSTQSMLIDFVLVYSLDDSKAMLDDAIIDATVAGAKSSSSSSSSRKHTKRQVLKQIELKKRTPKQKRVRFRKFFIHNLKTSGLIIKKVVDKQTKLVYLLVHTPLVKLLEVAEKTKLKLPIEVNFFCF